MDIRPIRSAADHDAALGEIARLWGAPDGSPEGDRLDVLATLVDAYENARHPLPKSDPVALLRYAIADMGRSEAELATLIGSAGLASDILARRSPLTLDMIRRIASAWRLPIEALAAPYDLSIEYA